MPAEDDKSIHTVLKAEESAELTRRWERGELQRHIERLLAFVEQEHAEILHQAGGRRDAASLVQATKHIIAQLRSVHVQSEMHDQLREIHNEIWFRGEEGEHDRERIKHEWATRHAANWRHWRIKEYMHVADRCAAEIMKRFAQP